jgi:hypothetical protein
MAIMALTRSWLKLTDMTTAATAVRPIYIKKDVTGVLVQKDQAPSSRVKNSWITESLRIGPISCPETSPRICHYPLRNDPDEHSCHLLRGQSLKSRTIAGCYENR